jgi:hypothetical protein
MQLNGGNKGAKKYRREIYTLKSIRPIGTVAARHLSPSSIESAFRPTIRVWGSWFSDHFRGAKDEVHEKPHKR